MKKSDCQKRKPLDLLRRYSEILDELKRMKVVRTRNNPVSDYAEWLVAKRFGLKLQNNSKSGFDALNKKGIRFQIKSRRIDPANNSRQLGVIRNLKKHEFDYLIGIIFDKDFTVKEAYVIPLKMIEKYSRFSKHQNGHILRLHGSITREKEVKNITHKFS